MKFNRMNTYQNVIFDRIDEFDSGFCCRVCFLVPRFILKFDEHAKSYEQYTQSDHLTVRNRNETCDDLHMIYIYTITIHNQLSDIRNTALCYSP